MFDWFSSIYIVVYVNESTYLVFIGVRGLQPYLLIRILRKTGSMQTIPRVRNMDRYIIDYKSDKIMFVKDIIKMRRKKKSIKINYGGSLA